MKTQFEFEEIKEFLLKKKDEIVGEQMLNNAFTDFRNPENIPQMDDLFDAFTEIFKLGLAQGKIEGKCEVMNDVIEFFKL
jgi:hypothetical protein